MAKPPHNVHELMLALTRIAGNNIKAVEFRNLLAMTIVSQMLPKGSVVKGGSSLRVRLGPGNCRVTRDLDAARSMDEDSFLMTLKENLSVGWNDFTGFALKGEKRRVEDLDECYVMQPVDIKLSYRGKPLCTVELEISHNEIGDADTFEERGLPESVAKMFTDLNLPLPGPIPLMTIPYQIAQKLHGLTESNSKRVRDLVDLQLIIKNCEISYPEVATICRRLFAYRQKQAWPPKVVANTKWSENYESARQELSDVLPSVDEAIIWANELIAKIDAA